MNSLFLTNDKDRNFLSKLRQNLDECKSFCLSVSFIKSAGLKLIINDIKNALDRGVNGKIITSTYQNFTDYQVLVELKKLADEYSNFTCHLDFDSFETEDKSGYRGFHSKGYLFEFDGRFETIIGSSNITRFALLSNIEWDVDVVEDENHPLYDTTRAEFEDMWGQTHELNDNVIEEYRYYVSFQVTQLPGVNGTESKVKPNFMQRSALSELDRFRRLGIVRALVIAAAGSGKTYLAAFDARACNPKKLLYVVHNGAILERSIETFKDVFGDSVTYGRYYEGYTDYDADFVFSTNLSISGNIDMFFENQFDYIIIDECHHAWASTYKKIIEHFNPSFLLGLTATPDRMDGNDVLELFDNNVACEIRLRDSIVQGMILPFKYYAVKDNVNGINYGLDVKEIAKLDIASASDEHVEFIKEQIEAHRPNKEGSDSEKQKIKALAFCRSVQHARQLCFKLGSYYKTEYLTGRDSIEKRVSTFRDLQSDEEGSLQILFAVDILNEGVDLPGVNMVIFLRPTDSSTIFIQQLGRGLRKSEGISYCTVLDLIGNNYRRSAQIAVALCGLSFDTVMDKPTLEQFIRTGYVDEDLKDAGVEIHIDKESMDEILKSINSMRSNVKDTMEQNYRSFQRYLNISTYPKHMDYLNNDCAPDLIKFMNIKMYMNKKNRSYYNFLRSVHEDSIPMFSEKEVEFINKLSEYLPLVRNYEYLIIKAILEGIDTYVAISEYVLPFNISLSIEGDAEKKADASRVHKEMMHAVNYLLENGVIAIQNVGGELKYTLPLEVTGDLREYVDDLIAYGLNRYTLEYGEENGLKLYSTYRMEQVHMKFLRSPTVTQAGTEYIQKDDGGYKVIVYVLLNKDLDIEERLNYKDKFLTRNQLQWESMNHLPDGQYKNIMHPKTEVYLFVRKVPQTDGITTPYTYVGRGKFSIPEAEKDERGRHRMTGTGSYVFNISLFDELPENLWNDLRPPE